MKLETAAARMECLGHPLRLRLYRMLVRAGVEGLPVGSLQERLGIPGSTLSHHVRKLMVADLITQERHGTTLVCRTNYSVMTGLIAYLADECCADGTRPAEAQGSP